MHARDQELQKRKDKSRATYNALKRAAPGDSEVRGAHVLCVFARPVVLSGCGARAQPAAVAAAVKASRKVESLPQALVTGIVRRCVAVRERASTASSAPPTDLVRARAPPPLAGAAEASAFQEGRQ